MIYPFILIMIYSNSMIEAEPYIGIDCAAEAKTKIGQKYHPLMWDNMNGSHPIPKIIIAFCAEGATQ